MNDDWVETTLGEVASVNPTEPQLPSEAPFITMADVDEWRTWARSSTSKGSRGGIRARGGDTLFARITPCLENGKIAMVPARFGAVGGSTEFIVLRARADVIPEFLFLWAASAATHSAAVGLMVGTTGRQRVSGRDLISLPISLPPLPVQRRIVDLMAHLDNQIANLRLERDAAESILWAMLTEWSSTGFSESTVTLGSVCNLRSGPSWAADSESRHWSPEARRVVKITNTRPDGSLDMTEATYVTGLPGSVALLSDASLILIRTNGNRGRIGNAYRPDSVALGCAVSAFQFVGDADSITDRDWIYWWLRVPAIQQEMSESASGTTGLGNLAVRWLRGLELPWPPLAERAKAVDLFNATLQHVQSISNELCAAQGLRTALLTTVLAAETLIDSLYDSLLDGVA